MMRLRSILDVEQVIELLLRRQRRRGLRFEQKCFAARSKSADPEPKATRARVARRVSLPTKTQCRLLTDYF